MSRFRFAAFSAFRAVRTASASACSARSELVTFWKALMTVLRVLSVRLFERGLRSLLLVEKRHAVEDRLREIGRRRIEPGAGHEKLCNLEGAGPQIGGERQIGQPVRDRDADIGRGLMQRGLRRPDVRPLRDEPRRHGDGHGRGKFEIR